MIHFSGFKHVMGKARTITKTSLIFHMALSMSPLQFKANLITFKQSLLNGRDGIQV